MQCTAKFLNDFKPVIINMIRKEKVNPRSWEWEDLIQEGNLAVLQAFKTWKAEGKRKTVDLKTWAAICVSSRFKDLKKINSIPEILVEDIEALPEQEESEFDLQNLDVDAIRISLCKMSPKYRIFLERALDWSLPQVAIAKDIGKKRQRISQLKQDVKKTFSSYCHSHQQVG
jgi:RNA polymerase sigma factor (sigma-70 family)